MKKILIVFSLFWIFAMRVDASDFSTSISTNNNLTLNQEFTVSIKVNSSETLYGVMGKLSYDSSKIKLLSYTGASNFNITYGTNIVADSLSGSKGLFGFISIKFKATSNFSIGQNTTITFNGVSGTNGTKDLSGSSSNAIINMRSNNADLSNITIDGKTIFGFSGSKTEYNITVENDISTLNIAATLADTKSKLSGTGNKKLEIYKNHFELIVTSEYGNTKKYFINIYRKDENGLTSKPSSNNNLSSISIEGYEISFSKDVLIYNVSVENNITALNITSIPEDKNSIVTMGSTNLNVGENTITISVIAQDKTTKEYKIVVFRKSDGPTTTVDRFLLDTTNVYDKTVNINLGESGVISKDIMNLAYKNNLTLYINKYIDNNLIYRWIIEDVKSSESIDTTLEFNPAYKENIEKITNYANGLYVNFPELKSTSKNIYVEINVSKLYKDGTKLYLYDFDKDKKQLNRTDTILTVKDGLVKLRPNYSSDNFLSMYDSNKNTSKYSFIVIFLAIVNVFMIAVYFVVFKKNIIIKKSK